MANRVPNPQDENFDPFSSFRRMMRVDPPWDNIIDFATHRSFCGKRLYPRQATLLKLIYLETESMTPFDLDVIEQWRTGFKDRTRPWGVQPDIWDRVEYLKAHGYHHFPHIQAVMGRRASKGITGGILGAERVAYMYSLGNWQAHYGLDPGVVGEVTVVATTQGQAAKRQFADIRRTVEKCEYLKRALVSSKYTEFAIRTPGDEDAIADMVAQGVIVDREIATLYAVAASATSSSQRGGSGFFNCLDPETPVLTADLRWVPIRTLCPGDEIVAVDEDVESGCQRKVRRATVINRWTTRKKAYRLTFDDGRSVVCSGDHRWLCQINGKARIAKWRVTRGDCDARSIGPGTKIFELVEPWDKDDSRDAGYLAGMYDGEGCISNRTKSSKGFEVFVSQKPGAVLNLTLQLLKEKGFVPMPCNSASYRKTTDRTAEQWSIRGLGQVLRFLGQIRPERLLAKAHLAYEGGSMRGVGTRTVVSVEELPEQELVDISTTTGTFIADGLVSHNCYDEMAHMIVGTGSSKSDAEIYEAYQPSLDQFGKDKMTYVASSPFSKIGKFYELYKQGSVTLDVYNAREGRMETRTLTEQSEGVDAEEEIEALIADPEMLVVQLPSWALYEDWETSTTIPMMPNKPRCFRGIKRPVQYSPLGDKPENKAMAIMKAKNPEKFKVEREGQFASVMDAYLNEVMVDRMFEPPTWRAPLAPQDQGKFSLLYRAHADPSRTNANFGFAIGHIEDLPPDDFGDVWQCVIIDKLHVWKPENFPDHTIDYVQVTHELDDYLYKFPSMTMMSYDQYNSAGFISHQRRKFPKIRVVEKTFTPKENQDRFEKFKSALNLGWVKSYRDTFFEDGQSLLEMELKFLQEKNGKVDKQEFGPVQTKDLADAVMVVTVDLLHQNLDRWQHRMNRLAVGSTYSAGLKSGREFERLSLATDHSPRSERALKRAQLNRENLARQRDARLDRRGGVSLREPVTNRSRGRRF